MENFFSFVLSFFVLQRRKKIQNFFTKASFEVVKQKKKRMFRAKSKNFKRHGSGGGEIWNYFHFTQLCFKTRRTNCKSMIKFIKIFQKKVENRRKWMENSNLTAKKRDESWERRRRALLCVMSMSTQEHRQRVDEKNEKFFVKYLLKFLWFAQKFCSYQLLPLTHSTSFHWAARFNSRWRGDFSLGRTLCTVCRSEWKTQIDIRVLIQSLMHMNAKSSWTRFKRCCVNFEFR